MNAGKRIRNVQGYGGIKRNVLKNKTSTSMSNFPGFSPKAFKFLEDLTNYQTKIWFDEHRSEYEEFVREPMKLFTDVLSESSISYSIDVS